LPVDIQEKLRELELELAEGDITQKGFEKKRDKLIAPFDRPPSQQIGMNIWFENKKIYIFFI